MTDALDILHGHRDRIAAENRQHMPIVGELVAACREVFGPGVRVLWAEEDGKKRGQRSQYEAMADEFGARPSIVPETLAKLKRNFQRTQRAMGIQTE